MNQLIQSIQAVLNGYRSHNGEGTFRITEASIQKWIGQFDGLDRLFILQELESIFKKSYFSQTRTRLHLKHLLEVRGKALGYPNTKDFLKDAVLLDCQPEGKSQKALLVLVKKIIEEDFELEISEVGSSKKKHYIYIDDVLCTGTTFHQNILDWSNTEEDGVKMIDKIKSKAINLNVIYLAASEKAYDKKIGQFYYDFYRSNAEKGFHILVGRWIEKSSLKPLNANQPQSVYDYEQEVIEQANQHAAKKGFNAYSPDFYRTEDSISEDFFTSAENRNRIENIFLAKGVEILSRANITKQNIRPLGFALPATKTFGFGALFFTWRNIANNTPLVFWYRGGGFEPLFENVR
jgi:hypothetical protein